jgi:hypothetical protein
MRLAADGFFLSFYSVPLDVPVVKSKLKEKVSNFRPGENPENIENGFLFEPQR